MFDWGVLKRGVPELVQFLHWQPPDVHIFDTDASLQNSSIQVDWSIVIA